MSPFAAQWQLDPEVVFLNHGAFGACPTAVLAEQTAWRARLEREPVRFMVNELEAALDHARAAVAAFVGSDPRSLVFVANATAGVNTVLASLPLRPGDEILVTDHGYNACNNAARHWAARAGANVVVAGVPVPLHEPGEVVAAVLAAVTPRTRVAIVDHVTSPTGIVFPAAELVKALRERGVLSLIDGAHAPGMLPLDLAALDADYYAANLHKWCCTPKGSAILVARPEHHATLRPLVVSHGANSRRTDRPKLWLEFDWVGTPDPTAVLATPRALEFLAGLLPGGFPALRAHNHELVRFARRVLLEAVGTEPLCPESMLGSLASVALPDAPQAPGFEASPFAEPLYGELCKRGFQALATFWPAEPRRVVRVTAELYNDRAQYERFANAVRELV
ncbi:MAG TPA: aminotransferase class V-fold PLP-dependent enzyme [Polyangiaceae bacterium]|nr:aminotransferase class V-fold PLP-dependent enzyme [Polyangiaceae bacterium]